jgi:hypothetical protein
MKSRRRFNPDWNAHLTSVIGLTLLLLTLVEFGTLLGGLQHFLSLHVFVGVVLLPPIAVKLASTGWRFARYYSGNDAYRLHGPPRLLMRLLAPILILLTIVLFGSGVAMGVLHGSLLQTARQLHGPAAFLWTVVLGVHVLVYLPRAVRNIRGRSVPRMRSTVGRIRPELVAVSALCVGLVAALATLPGMHRWLHIHGGTDDRGALVSRP